MCGQCKETQASIVDDSSKVRCAVFLAEDRKVTNMVIDRSETVRVRGSDERDPSVRGISNVPQTGCRVRYQSRRLSGDSTVLKDAVVWRKVAMNGDLYRFDC